MQSKCLATVFITKDEIVNLLQNVGPLQCMVRLHVEKIYMLKICGHNLYKVFELIFKHTQKGDIVLIHN